MGEARLIWYHFSDHQTTDGSGKCSYIGVFDEANVGICVPEGGPEVPIPLPNPVTTAPFVLTLHIQAQAGEKETVEVKVKDADGERVMPTFRGEIGPNPNGQHNMHLRFANGLPVTKPGIYTFEVSVGGVGLREIELPVDIRIQRGNK